MLLRESHTGYRHLLKNRQQSHCQARTTHTLYFTAETACSGLLIFPSYETYFQFPVRPLFTGRVGPRPVYHASHRG